MDLEYYNSYLEIDTNAICENYRKIQKLIGDEHDVMPVIKANAYGQGEAEIARLLHDECGTKICAVAQVYEGRKIREAGIQDMEILVMGAAAEHLMPYIVEYNLQPAVFSPAGVFALDKAAKAANKTAKAQIKIETGLNRIGAKPGDEMAELLAALKKCHNVEITGAFTHFATSTEYYSAFTKEQYALYLQGLEQIKKDGITLTYEHCCNTGATLWYNEAYGTHVRVGALYLGYSCMDDHSNPLGVRETASWRAQITNLRTVMPGEGVSYDRHFMPTAPTRVATINVGYCDGLYRPTGQNGGPVLVGDTKTKYLATCMDQSFVDVTGIDCKIGDEVTLIGYSGSGKTLLSAQEINAFMGNQSLSYQLCLITDRVKRIYKK